jgi:hypothetical protein
MYLLDLERTIPSSILPLQGEEVAFELELIGDMILFVSNAENAFFWSSFGSENCSVLKHQLFYILVPVRNFTHDFISILIFMIHWHRILVT